MPAPHSTPLSFDDALVKNIGQFGTSQKRVFLAASVQWVPNAMFILLMVFANKDPIAARWWHCTDAADASCHAVLDASDPGINFCSLDPSQWQWTHANWSIVSQFNLVCKRSILAQLANSAFFLGYLIGSGVFGNMADQHGRRITLLIALGCCTGFTLMSGLSANYWVYLVSRILVGVGAAGQALVTYLLATESIGPSWRGNAGIGTQMFFILGEFLLILVAYLLWQWRLMCFAITVLGAASFAPLLLVPESPRWLLAKGRKDQAVMVMEKMAAANGTQMPYEPLADPAPTSGGASMTMGSILKDRHIARRFFVLAYVWCILCMTYYGISLALNGLKGSIYMSFIIAAAAELPSSLLAAWLIEKIGRHNSLAAGMLLGGVACLICSSCPPGPGQAVLAAIGKLGCAGAFNIASIYTSELFPTLVRSAVLGAENEAARVGGIAAPFIVLLGTQLNNPSMPFLVFGATSVLAGLLIFTLPETHGAPLPDTMQDMEAIQSIFSTGSWRKGWGAMRGELFSTRAHGAKQHIHLAAISEEPLATSSVSASVLYTQREAAPAADRTAEEPSSSGAATHMVHLQARAGAGVRPVSSGAAEAADTAAESVSLLHSDQARSTGNGSM